jgi:cytoskeleton protein RodZ
MPSAGAELRQARERLGLSAEHIEERTKVHLDKIEALESGNFEGLPAGIYLEGIVRAYAHVVELDAEPLILRVRAERAKAAEDWEVSFGDLNGLLHAHENRRVPPADDLQRDSTPVERMMFRESTGRLWPRRVRRQQRNVALPLLALLASAGWSAYFYEVARRPARDQPRAVAAESSSARAQSPPVPGMTAGENTAATSVPPSPAATTPSPSLEAKAVPAPEASAATAGTTTTAPPPLEEIVPSAPPVAPAGDVSGNWRLAARVESTSADSTGLNVGYDIALQQTGERITGSGRKVSENGAAIGAQVQTPISLAGTMAGNRVTLTFTERGAQRPTEGKLVLLLEEGGTLRGRFSSTAAQGSGTVFAQRVTPIH